MKIHSSADSKYKLSAVLVQFNISEVKDYEQVQTACF